MPTMTTTAKNNRKHLNNCTLECIGLSVCTELSLKLQREKTFFRVVRQKNKTPTTRTKKWRLLTRNVVFLSRRRSRSRPRCFTRSLLFTSDVSWSEYSFRRSVSQPIKTEIILILWKRNQPIENVYLHYSSLKFLKPEFSLFKILFLIRQFLNI